MRLCVGRGEEEKKREDAKNEKGYFVIELFRNDLYAIALHLGQPGSKLSIEF